MRTQWTEELIEASLLEIVTKLGRMPSVQELGNSGRWDLANVIARRGGFKKWADRMGVAQKGTETHRGLAIQATVGRALRSHGYQIEEMTTRAPYDLLVNDRLRIDVKSARCYTYKKKHDQLTPVGYIFGLNKRVPTCDLYILCCLSDDDKILERYYVPSSEARIVTITITPTGRYLQFKESIEQIDRLLS